MASFSSYYSPDLICFSAPLFTIGLLGIDHGTRVRGSTPNSTIVNGRTCTRRSKSYSERTVAASLRSGIQRRASRQNRMRRSAAALQRPGQDSEDHPIVPQQRRVGGRPAASYASRDPAAVVPRRQPQLPWHGGRRPASLCIQRLCARRAPPLSRARPSWVDLLQGVMICDDMLTTCSPLQFRFIPLPDECVIDPGHHSGGVPSEFHSVSTYPELSDDGNDVRIRFLAMDRAITTWTIQRREGWPGGNRSGPRARPSTSATSSRPTRASTCASCTRSCPSSSAATSWLHFCYRLQQGDYFLCCLAPKIFPEVEAVAEPGFSNWVCKTVQHLSHNLKDP